MERESIFTIDEKKTICNNIVQMLNSSGMSAPKFAVSIGFNRSDMSNIKTLAWIKSPHLIGEQKWIRLAQKANFVKDAEVFLRQADTDMYTYITEQLRICQDASICGLLCDSAGVGKTYSCKQYQANNANVVYIDCSLCPTPSQFKKAFTIAQGVSAGGNINDNFAAAIIAAKQHYKQLIILDEAGDLDNLTFRTIKRLYNDLEDICGIYMLGAGGLRKKIEAGIGCDVVGFEEVFSRFGCDYGRHTPDPKSVGIPAFQERMKSEMQIILQANGFDRQTSAALSERMKNRDLRAIKRSIRATQNSGITNLNAI